MTASHSSSLMLTSTRSRRIPALLTSTSRPPNVSMAVSTRRLPPSQSVTSSWLATPSPPAATISSTTCWAALTSSPDPWSDPPRSLTTTLAPSAANSSAYSRPMPRPAPVMMAIRPSSAPMSSTSLVSAPTGRAGAWSWPRTGRSAVGGVRVPDRGRPFGPAPVTHPTHVPIGPGTGSSRCGRSGSCPAQAAVTGTGRSTRRPSPAASAAPAMARTRGPAPHSTTYSVLRRCDTVPTLRPFGSWMPMRAPT